MFEENNPKDRETKNTKPTHSILWTLPPVPANYNKEC
jgi:hypothetical protein